jgi:hypothetical protein
MDNQFSVVSFRMECSVATSRDSKSIVLESLYHRFHMCVSRNRPCVGQWSTLDSLSDLVQIGRHVFAWIWNKIRFHIYMSVDYVQKLALTSTVTFFKPSITGVTNSGALYMHCLGLLQNGSATYSNEPSCQSVQARPQLAQSRLSKS